MFATILLPVKTSTKRIRLLALLLFIGCWMLNIGCSRLDAQPNVSFSPPPFRAAWIASVHNLNFPSRPGLSPETQKREIDSLLDLAASLRLTAVLLQVRPEGDALYRSPLEPWSHWLTGAQGRDPGFDPLAYAVAQAHRRNIQLHAWFNPFRASTSATRAFATGHPALRFPAALRRVEGQLVMDPGDPQVREHIIRVITDVARRYPIDGVHLDDYFYPYPKDATRPPKFPDTSLHAAYRSAGGPLQLADWRRENINTFVSRLRSALRATRPGILFGISPFGIYRPGIPAGTEAKLDQYAMIYSDPVRWLHEGWVDYLAPQLYWRESSPQGYSTLLRWWRGPQANPRRIPIYPGLALDRLSEQNWPLQEIQNQIISNTSIPAPRQGEIYWSIRSLARDTKGVRTWLQSR